jgi:hypothetical protein
MSLTDTFKRNLGLKALSLLLAALLWFSLTFGHDEEVRLTVPVVLTNIPPQLSVAGRPPTAVELDVAGPKILLVNLTHERLTATLDFGGVGEGTVSFVNLDRTVRLRSGLRVTRVQPAALELKLVKAETKQPAHPGL